MRDHHVVGHEIIELVEVFGKGRCGGHIAGGDPVDGNIARVKPVETGRRLQQGVVGFGQLTVANFDGADRAGRAPKTVGGFKVDGGEIHLTNTPVWVWTSARYALPSDDR